ncbi:hypothetical protein M0R45_035895 [Rubus argutus]|uniref:Uncharacterized protein n=1 Tax=Rubus argutus TaxID=59490 RepID=A0AAW1VYC4_RUBAR
MDQMEYARGRHRQWRQSMSSSQRQAYLARQQAQARGKRPMVETSHDYQLQAGPSNRNEQSLEEFDNEGSSSRIPSNSNNHDQDFSRVRLTRIRQLARSGRSQINDDVVQNSARHNVPVVSMNNGEQNNNNEAMNNEEEQDNNNEAMNIDDEQDNDNINTHDNNGRPMSCCDYYAYMLQMRQLLENPLHRGGRLLQQTSRLPKCWGKQCG